MDKLDELIHNYQKIGDDIKKYNTLHQIYAYKNYDNFNVAKKKMSSTYETELANYLHDNYDYMSKEEMCHMLIKCLNIIQVKKLLLEFEFYNYRPTPVAYMSFSEYIPICRKLLVRYQSKAAGFDLDDTEWRLYTHDVKNDYDLDSNEIIFENTINYKDNDKDENIGFFVRLENILDNIAENMDVKVTYLETDKDDKIYVVIINVRDLTMKMTQNNSDSSNDN